MSVRDENREFKRQQMAQAGLDRILSGSIEALRSLLNPSSLSERTNISRDTAYRLFRDEATGKGTGNGTGTTTQTRQPSGGATDALVRHVAESATRTEWSGYDRSFAKVGQAFQDAIVNECTLEEAVVRAMAANAECQLDSPGGPVGWILHAAALTASPAWAGECTLSQEDQQLGRQILELRRAFYQRMADDMSQIMNAAMSVLGRRPRRGMDPAQLVALVHSFLDGAVLRQFIDPDAFDSRLIGEAAVALAMAFSEEGAISDPRRPAMVDGSEVFDRMLVAAAAEWNVDTDRTVELTARQADVAPEAAMLLFPTIADLADSVVWSLVLGGGTLSASSLAADQDARTRPEVAMLHGILRLLRDVADRLPGAVVLVTTTQPALGLGVREQLVREASEILRRNVPTVNPRVTAGELVSAALLGTGGWPQVTSLMRVLIGSLEDAGLG